ncbi:unnamed protein product [Boreogadus saida]
MTSASEKCGRRYKRLSFNSHDIKVALETRPQPQESPSNPGSAPGAHQHTRRPHKTREAGQHSLLGEGTQQGEFWVGARGLRSG